MMLQVIGNKTGIKSVLMLSRQMIVYTILRCEAHLRSCFNCWTLFILETTISSRFNKIFVILTFYEYKTLKKTLISSMPLTIILLSTFSMVLIFFDWVGEVLSPSVKRAVSSILKQFSKLYGFILTFSNVLSMYFFFVFTKDFPNSTKLSQKQIIFEQHFPKLLQ